jgi:hypothetical protein
MECISVFPKACAISFIFLICNLQYLLQGAHCPAENRTRELCVTSASPQCSLFLSVSQDRDNLYFVMEYIPGGDLMSLLIKFGIFQESLARSVTALIFWIIEDPDPACVFFP